MRDTRFNDRLRSLFLTALLVASVFAGSLAVTGSGAAATDADGNITSAVEYTYGAGYDLEVALDQRLDGDEDVVVLSGGVRAVDEKYDGHTIRADLSGDVPPVRNLSIKVVSNGTTVDTATNVDVTATPINEDTDLDETVYTGEPIAIVADQKNERLVISGGDTTIVSSTGPHTQVYRYDTDKLTSGVTYTVEFRGNQTGYGYPDTETFTLTNLELEADAGSTSLFDDQDLTAAATIRRGGVNAEAALVDSDGETVETITKELSANSETTFDFGQTAPGNYTVTVTDAFTEVTASTDTIHVAKRPPADVSLTPAVVEEHRGDVATIAINASNTDEATVVVGSDASGYWLEANVTDDNGDGRIVLQFNTYTAGNEYAANDTDVPASAVLWSSEDTVVDVNQGGSYVASDHDVGADTIDAGSYDMNVTAGHVEPETVTPGAVGTLAVRERATNNLTVMVAPKSTDVASMSAADVRAALGSSITRTDAIADSDVLVHQLEASGIEGAIAFHANATSGVLDGTVDLSIAPTESGMNADATDLALAHGNVAVVPHAANDTYYVAVETGEVAVENGREYNSTVDVSGTLAVGPPVSDTWSNVATSASLMTNDQGLVIVQPAPAQNVTGTTNLAPGTELTVTMESTTAASPFLATPTATVQPDGTVTATTDAFADVAAGTNFSVRLRRGTSVLATADGRVVNATTNGTGTPTPGSNGTATPTADPAPQPNGTASPTPTPTPTPTATPTATPTSTPSPTPNQTSAGTTPGAGPGFGVAVALLAVVGTALLAARRDD